MNRIKEYLQLQNKFRHKNSFLNSETSGSSSLLLSCSILLQQVLHSSVISVSSVAKLPDLVSTGLGKENLCSI